MVCVRQEIEKNFIRFDMKMLNVMFWIHSGLFRPNFESEFKYLVVTLADNFLETIIPKVRETKVGAGRQKWRTEP